MLRIAIAFWLSLGLVLGQALSISCCCEVVSCDQEIPVQPQKEGCCSERPLSSSQESQDFSFFHCFCVKTPYVVQQNTVSGAQETKVPNLQKSLAPPFSLALLSSPKTFSILLPDDSTSLSRYLVLQVLRI